MTPEQAITMSRSNWWVELSPTEIVRFQLGERLLCMPFAIFHEAVEQVLGRPVYTHEFADPGALSAELESKAVP